MRPAEPSAMAPSLVSVTIASNLMKPPKLKRVPGLAPGMVVLAWIGWAGGTGFAYLPCLNDAAPGMAMLETLARRELSGWQ